MSKLLDEDRVLQTLKVLHPTLGDHCVEVRVLGAQRGRSNRTFGLLGYFDAPDQVVKSLQGLTSWTGVYMTLNPLKRDLLARANNRLVPMEKGKGTKDSDVAFRRWFLVDIDPERLSGVSSTREEVERAAHMASELCGTLSEPAVKAFSGNGFHLIYKANGIPEDDIKRANQGLDKLFSTSDITVDPTVYSPAQLTCLYGTLKAKGDSLEDRPHRLSRIGEIAEEDPEVVNFEHLFTMLPDPADNVRHTQRKKHKLSQWIENHDLNVGVPRNWRDGGRKWIFVKCPWAEDDDSHDGKAFLLQFANGAISAGCLKAGCGCDKKGRVGWKSLVKKYGPLSGGKAAQEQDVPALSDTQYPWELTEIGFTEKFVQTYHGAALHHMRDGWYLFDGKVYRPDKKKHVLHLCKALADDLPAYIEAAELPAHKRLLGQVFSRMRSLQGIKAIPELAGCHPALAVVDDCFDHIEHLIPALNGTIDLTTGELHPFDRNHLFTKTLTVDYRPEAKCPEWMAYLKSCHADNPDIIDYLQQLAGLALTGDTSEQIMVIFKGGGNDGKSTFVETLQALFGEWATPIASEGLTTGDPRHTAHTTSLMDFKGHRLALVAELKGACYLAEHVIKLLTTTGKVVARRMRQDFQSFSTQHLLIMETNKMPRILGQDNGIWRRIRVVPWNLSLRESEVDKGLKKRVLQELEGILAWAVQGAVKYYKNKRLVTPESVTNATGAFRTSQDPLATLFHPEVGKVEFHKAGRIKAKTLYDIYVQTCEDEGANPVQKKTFKDIMEERGAIHKRQSGMVCYIGVRLKEKDDGL